MQGAQGQLGLKGIRTMTPPPARSSPPSMAAAPELNPQSCPAHRNGVKGRGHAGGGSRFGVGWGGRFGAGGATLLGTGVFCP